ncbi:MAG: putative bifunctional diguanylate cyclase/phosphodiesterase [Pseudomonadota bacterium]
MNTTAARIADFAFEPLPVDAYALRGQVERQELPDLIERVARTHGEQKSVFALLAVRVLREDIAALMFDPATERILLREALQQLTQVLRANDSVSIIAPDEMVLVLTGLPSADLAELAAARLVQCFADPFLVQGAPRRLHAAIGVACGPAKNTGAGELLRAARAAARTAETSQHGYVVHQASTSTDPSLGLEAAFRRAVSANDLSLAFQPQIDLATGRAVGAEALSRWYGPHGQAVRPDLFIEIATRCGLMHQLTRWVLNASLREFSGVWALGYAVDLSVNVSPVDLHEADFPDMVEHALDTWSVTADRLTLEITETAPVREPRQVLSILERLRRIGVRLSIDDFGTGHSSLALLRQLPVNELKIDQQFVRGMRESKASLDIVRTTLDLSRNFGLSTVAEGIEDPETLAALRDLGCQSGQGWTIARPAPIDQLVEWLRARAPAASAAPEAQPRG